MIRVLHVLNNLGYGGAEAFIMNIYRNIDRDKIQFDFLVRSHLNEKYEEEIKKLGGNIYITSPFPKKIIKNYKETKQFFKENYKKYNIVHVHANSLLYMLPLKLAKKYEIRTRIIHSHSTQSQSIIFKIIHKFNKIRINKYANVFFACTPDAGKWMFKTNFSVINNAIDIDKYKYDSQVRVKIRKELNIQNKLVIGHVGRLTKVKNHLFLLRIFKEILKINNNAMLLLVGDGELKSELEKQCYELNIEKKVIFLGNKSNVNEYLNAMDIFVFPSLYEGLGISVIEAQCSGLPCIVSENIPKEAFLTDDIHVISLTTPIEQWVNKILKYSCNYKRLDISRTVAEAGFDIKNNAKKIQQFYWEKGR